MPDTDETSHSDLFGEELDTDARSAGRESLVYNESSVPTLDSDRDGRSKTVLVSRDLVPAAGELLVDVVTYAPDVGVEEHYHQGTDHFFYVLEGEGILEVEDEEIDLTEGSVAWIGEGDRHRLFTREDQSMRVLEYFSNDEHEVTFLGSRHTWESAESDGT